MLRRRPVVLTAVVLFGSLAGFWTGVEHRTASAPWTVVEVVDGDTIDVARGGATDTIRLLGVDTPETHHPTKGVQCFGPAASRYSRRRLLGRQVRLDGDVEGRDIYGRRLAYVYLGEHRFNDELLRKGYARLLVIAPNREHGREMLAAELEARHADRGLWGACPDP